MTGPFKMKGFSGFGNSPAKDAGHDPEKAADHGPHSESDPAAMEGQENESGTKVLDASGNWVMKEKKSSALNMGLKHFTTAERHHRTSGGSGGGGRKSPARQRGHQNEVVTKTQLKPPVSYKSPAKHPHSEKVAHGKFGHNTDTGEAGGTKPKPIKQ